MTLTRRIWLGFGVLLACLLALGGTAYLGVRAIHEDTRRLTDPAQPTSESVVELRNHVLGTEAAVLGYLETGDPRYRDRITQHARMFEQTEREISPQIVSDKGEKALTRTADLYGEYRATTDRLMRERDVQRELLPGIEDDLQSSREALVDMQEGVERNEKGSDSELKELAKAEQGLDGTRTWLGAYLAYPRENYRERTADSVRRLRASLSRYQELDLTESERERAKELTNLLEESLPSVERMISPTASTGEGRSKLLELQTEMDKALDELRSSVRGDNSAAANAVDQTTGRISRITLAVLIGTCGIGVITAMVMGGGILGTVRRLAREARSIQAGRDQQVYVSTNDELGVLADVLNSVTEERKQDREELGHLGGLLREKATQVAELEATIGDLRRGEREMRETRQRNRLAARALNYGVFEWDLRKDEVHWNDTSLELFGRTREQSMPTFEAFLATVHPEDRIRIRDSVANHIEHEAPFDEEYRIRHADGGYRCVVSRLQTERSTDGTPLLVAGIIWDVTERKALERQLEGMAFYDPLTTLPNRSLFMDRLKNALDRSERQGARLAVLFLDLDNFKNVNDSLGHEAGDRALVATAERLQACLRPGDTVARFGGDEFTVLLEKIGVVEARRVAERILEELRTPIAIDGRRFYLTPSIGVAFSDSETEPDDLLRNADSAMYEAKRCGKARYEMFHTSMSTNVLERLELENDLRRAVEEEEFVVYYQPKVLLDSLKVFAFEALVRWKHPRRGLLTPDEFIPIAEETNLILPIGNWVLRQACAQVRAWQEEHPGEPPLMVSVNLSPRQFQQPDLSEAIAQLLGETGLAPESLMLEITENVLMEDMYAAGVTLQHLRDQRVSIAIDDFGTAYSSLARLKHWPIDTLKVDRSFIGGLGEGKDDDVLVSSIIDMAAGLGLTVVAEGVETSKQLACLRALGCQKAQGYYFSRPLPSQAITSLLERQSLQ